MYGLAGAASLATLVLLTPGAAQAQGTAAADACTEQAAAIVVEIATSGAAVQVQLDPDDACLFFVSPLPTPAAVPVTMTATMAVPAADTAAISFESWVTQAAGDPYELITLLDSPANGANKRSMPAGTTLKSTVEETVIFWTGSYITDPLYGGKVEPVLIDGQTGVWRLKPGNTIIVQSVGAYMVINSTGQLTIDEAAGYEWPERSNTATACLPRAEAIRALEFKLTTPDLVFVTLDDLVNAENAPYLGARLRANDTGPATYDGKNTMTLIWTRTGEIEGSVIELITSGDKTLYLTATDGPVTATYSHTGAELCEDLNPDRDLLPLGLWGK